MSDRAPEKSNFVQTCSLLSQFLNGKVRFRDLSLGIGSKLEAPGKSDVSRDTKTMDFLGNMEKSSHTSQQDMISTGKAPREHKIAQLTIFYSGKLVVFDDFPVDKARAVMLLASRESPQSACAIFPVATADKINCTATAGAAVAVSADPPPKPVASPPPPPLPSQHAGSNGSALPIARRSSLHRFLEKRKDRATATAPYQLHNDHPVPSSSKNRPSSSNNNEDSSSNTENGLLDLNFKL